LLPPAHGNYATVLLPTNRNFAMSVKTGDHSRLSLANCCSAPNSLGFPVLLRFCDAQSGRSFHPLHRYPGLLARTRRRPFPNCGVAPPQAPTPDRESLPATIAQSTPVGPHPRRLDDARVRPTRLLRSAIVLRPSTLPGLHKAMSKQKYRMLFSPDRRRKSGPKGPSTELIHAVVEMKQRNPNWGCPRIAQQIALAFNIPIDKDVVRKDSRPSLPASSALRWSLLVDFPGPHERQALEYQKSRPSPMFPCPIRSWKG
jgi:hypothetical protein